MGIGLILMESLDERNAKRFAYRQRLYDGLARRAGSQAAEDRTLKPNRRASTAACT